MNAAGHTYYRHRTTGETRWDAPTPSSPSLPKSAAPLASPSGLDVGGGWVLYKDPANDHPYYYNITTGESLWAEEWLSMNGGAALPVEDDRPPPAPTFYTQPNPLGLPLVDLDEHFQDHLTSPDGQLELESEVSKLRSQVEAGVKKVRVKKSLKEDLLSLKDDIMGAVPVGVRLQMGVELPYKEDAGEGGDDSDSDSDPDDSGSSSSSDESSASDSDDIDIDVEAGESDYTESDSDDSSESDSNDEWEPGEMVAMLQHREYTN